jgi:pyruvate dehydrogenase E1 component
LGSGTILFEVMQAAGTLRQEGYAVAVYSITSYVELARDAERAEQADADDVEPAWLVSLFPDPAVPIVAATDYVRALPRMIASWITGPFTALGTDGFGMSERRSDLRAHYKIDAASIADAARKLTAS